MSSSKSNKSNKKKIVKTGKVESGVVLESPPPETFKIKVVKSRRRVPLSEHRAVPEALRRLSSYEANSERPFIEKLKAILSSPSKSTHDAYVEAKELLEHVRFDKVPEEGFDSRKFFFLSNVILTEVRALEEHGWSRVPISPEEGSRLLDELWLRHGAKTGA